MRRGNSDRNQAEAVLYMRQCGMTVHTLHGVGQGCPDLLVGWRQVTHLVEIKRVRDDGFTTQLNQLQKDWHATWAGDPVIVAVSGKDAVEQIDERHKGGSPK